MHKDTNKPNAMQIYLNIAEREYLREKSKLACIFSGAEYLRRSQR